MRLNLLVNSHKTLQNEPTVEIHIMERDTKVKMHWDGDHSGGGLRMPSTGYTPRMKAAILEYIRNKPELKTFITLTYPRSIGVVNDKSAKKTLARFCRWLVRQGITGIWVRGFNKDGRVHFHLLIDRAIEKADVFEYWRKCLRATWPNRPMRVFWPRVGVEKERDHDKLAGYLARYGEKQPPPWFGDSFGRSYAKFGPNKKLDKIVLIGSGQELAGVTRALKKVKTGHRRAKPRKMIGTKGRKRRYPAHKFQTSGVVGFQAKDTAAALNAALSNRRFQLTDRIKFGDANAAIGIKVTATAICVKPGGV